MSHNDSVEHVSKRYQTRQGWRMVLQDIDFKLKKGEKIGILGRNGAGKSTLIRLISGVEAPTSGENQAHDGVFLGRWRFPVLFRVACGYG